MEIKLIKEDTGKIKILFLDFKYDLNYEGFEKIIDSVYDNKEEVTIICDSELNEYKELIQSIVEESRKDDFIKTVNTAKQAKKELEEAELQVKAE